MGLGRLGDWLKGKAAARAEAPILARIDTQAHAEELIRSTLVGAAGGSPAVGWAKGAVVAFLAGACAAGALLIDNPGQLLEPGGGVKWAIKAGAMGLVAAGLYLKASPLPPKVDPDAVMPNGLGGVVIVPPAERKESR